VREGVGHRRLIKTFAEGVFTSEGLDQALSEFETLLGRGPSAVLVDGYDWNRPGCTAELSAIRSAARRVGAEIWMTARTPPGYDARPPQPITPGCAGCGALIDVGLLLEPHGDRVKVRLMKDFDEAPPSDVRLSLDGDTLRLVEDEEPVRASGSGSIPHR
jgi:hypothetical protein